LTAATKAKKLHRSGDESTQAIDLIDVSTLVKKIILNLSADKRKIQKQVFGNEDPS